MRVQEVDVQLEPGITSSALQLLPAQASGLVLFAHGSGSSRMSPRNAFVADALAESGIASLLLDLLTTREEAADRQTSEFRFDIGLLARRLARATQWVAAQANLRGFGLGYFGASTGAAAALVAAATVPSDIRAVVSRGGRPDLAGAHLTQVRSPTLLIVGGADHVVIDLNRRAAAQITARCELSIVPGATHLFEEPGALENVADLACAWFSRFL